MQPLVFHLAFPVTSLAKTRAFYVDVLGAGIGREHGEWIDIHFFGHQITLHECPAEVLSETQLGVRHFGVILPWIEWHDLAGALHAKNIEFRLRPTVSYKHTEKEEAKMKFIDPDGNTIELKAYRNVVAALKFKDGGNHPRYHDCHATPS